MLEDPARVWGCLAPWPQAPSAPAPTLPSRLAPELPAAPRISPGKRGCGGSLAACPHPSPQSAHREREERGHRGACWSELPQGKQKMGQGCLVAELGSCSKLSQGPPGLYKGGRGAAASPGPLPELAGQLEANRKVGAKTQTQGRRTRAHTHIKVQPALWVSALSGPCVKRLADPRG